MASFALKCLKMLDGLIFLIPEGIDGPRKINASAIQVAVNDVGVYIQADEIILPVFDAVLAHIVKNPNIQLWFVKGDRFVEEHAVILELDRDALLEAKGVWEYQKSVRRKLD